jgi:hypothetical protein
VLLCVPANRSVPADTAVVPEKGLLAAVRLRVPSPVLVRPVPATGALIVARSPASTDTETGVSV